LNVLNLIENYFIGFGKGEWMFFMRKDFESIIREKKEIFNYQQEEFLDSTNMVRTLDNLSNLPLFIIKSHTLIS
jgi:hypothetical protein